MDKQVMYKIWAKLTAEPEGYNILKDAHLFDERTKAAICLAYAIGQKKALEELMWGRSMNLGRPPRL